MGSVVAFIVGAKSGFELGRNEDFDGLKVGGGVSITT